MIDLSDLKAPGWQRVVAELASAAPDDRTYFERVMRVLAQASAARQAVLMLPDRSDGEDVEPRVEAVWPAPATVAGQTDGDPAAHVEHLEQLTAASRAAFASAQPRAFGLDTQQDQYYGTGPTRGSVMAIPLLSARGTAVAIVAMLLEPRSKDALRSTMAMAEVLAGYVHGYAAQSQLRQTQRASFALDLATRLIASLNQASGFKGAVMQVCNDIARQFGVDRVGLGWVKSDRVRLMALSDTEHIDRRLSMVQKLEAAMDECYDQDQPVLFPQPPETGEHGDVLLSQAIIHSHRELASGQANLRIASMPLRVDEDVIGVVTLESSGDGDIDLGTIEMLQAALDLVAPVLKIRRSDDRMLALRAWDSTLKGASWIVGPKHTAWKLGGLGVAALIAFVSLYKTPYLVTAQATIRPQVRRVVSMPREGVIESLGNGIDVGSNVVAGKTVLLTLDSSELQMQAIEAQAKIEEAERQADYARQKHDEAAAKRADLQADGYRAQRALLRYRIDQSTIKAPITGTIIQGDLEQRVGSTMKLGEPLFVIAPIGKPRKDLIVVARVDERDIGLLEAAQHAAEAGDPDGAAVGTLATKSSPNKRHRLMVKKILEVAQPEEGKNVFEVRATITSLDESGQPETLQPGMEGLARFRTKQHSLLWIGTRRILNTVRLWIWK